MFNDKDVAPNCAECEPEYQEVRAEDLWLPSNCRAVDSLTIRDLVTDIAFYMDNGYRVQLAWSIPNKEDRSNRLFSCSIIDASSRVNTIVISINRARLVKLAKSSIFLGMATLDRFWYSIMPVAKEIGVLDQHDMILPFLRAQVIGFDLVHSQRPNAFVGMRDAYRSEITLALPVVMAQMDHQDTLEVVRANRSNHGIPFPPRWYEHWCINRSEQTLLTVRAAFNQSVPIWGDWTYSDD